MKGEIEQETVLIALVDIKKDGIRKGASYRVLEDSPEDSDTVKVRCSDWKAREIPKSKFKSTPKPKAIKKK